MAELIFFRQEEEVLSFNLDEEELVRVGRGVENDIVLPTHEREISRYHFVVDHIHQQFFIRDLSGRGLKINHDQACAQHLLADEDSIEIGHWKILFSENSRLVEQTAHSQTTSEQTQSLKSKQPPTNLVATLSFQQKDRKKEYTLESKSILHIGKTEENDLVIDLPFVSGFHCRIYEKQGKFFVKDLNSTNGTFINGLKIIESELPAQATLQLGEFSMQWIQQESTSSEKKGPSSETFPLFDGMVSDHPSMKQVFQWIQRVADSEVPVLVQGESGTGKELVARSIHKRSFRNKEPFFALNCGVISPELIESILFGHEKGMFTGAIESRAGVFEQTQGGTLFLDEIGDLPLQQQAAFLRVLETGSFRRIGGTKEFQSHARVIAATHKDLREEVRQGRFREDLLFRINVLQIPLPPLRERKEDIDWLVRFFTHKYAGYRKIEWTQSALQQLREHPWNGNVRELRNLLQRTLIMNESQTIEPSHLLFDSFPSFHSLGSMDSLPSVVIPSSGSSVTSLQETEKQAILEALKACNQNMSQTARLLGIGRASLYAKMERFGLRNKK